MSHDYYIILLPKYGDSRDKALGHIIIALFPGLHPSFCCLQCREKKAAEWSLGTIEARAYVYNIIILHHIDVGSIEHIISAWQATGLCENFLKYSQTMCTRTQEYIMRSCST